MNTAKDISGNSGLPLIRLSLILPFLQHLDARKIDSDDILSEQGLSRDALTSTDIFVPAVTFYKVIEAMARTAQDPFLAVHIGENLDLAAWPVFTESVKHAASFGDFFFRFAAESVNQASSVQMRLDTDGEHATFRAYRVFEPSMVPAQADAFYVGLFTSIFQNCTAGKWNPHQVLIRLADPGAVPPGYHKLMISRGDRRGPSIRFPQKWLLLPMHISELDRHSINDVKYPTPPRSFIDAIRQALQPHINRTDLTAEIAAELCGYEKRALGRKLKASGSTLSKEIAKLREQQATRLFKETSQSIAEVSSSVGFSDPSIFSRAFKKWTGYSPRAYRKLYRKSV